MQILTFCMQPRRRCRCRSPSLPFCQFCYGSWLCTAVNHPTLPSVPSPFPSSIHSFMRARACMRSRRRRHLRKGPGRVAVKRISVHQTRALPLPPFHFWHLNPRRPHILEDVSFAHDARNFWGSSFSSIRPLFPAPRRLVGRTSHLLFPDFDPCRASTFASAGSVGVDQSNAPICSISATV